MKHELKHRAYRPTIGGRSISNNKMINELKDQAVNYIGTFSEYNPIGLGGGSTNWYAVYVKKETTVSINQQKPFELYGFQLKNAGGYHGSDFNNNGGVSFSKQDLLRIANAMDDTDSLIITCPDSIDSQSFRNSINKVTGL